MRSARKNALLTAILGVGLTVHVTGYGVTSSDRSREASLDIVVESLGGSVEVATSGSVSDVEVGSAIGLPARITTGGDGNISLRQSSTGVAIGPDSEIEIPQTARAGQLVARMVQHRGTVFYDVEPRPIEKLRIDTPNLVAVVKGTQFSVVASEDSTTVSLFEGVLEIRSPDADEGIELLAGQIAIATLAQGIRILPMDADLIDDAAAIDARTPGGGASAGGTSADAIAAAGRSADVDAVAAAGGTGRDAGVVVNGAVAAGADTSGSLDSSLGLRATAPSLATVTTLDVGLGPSLGGGVDVGLDTGVDVGLDTGVDVSADLGGVTSVALETNLDVGGDLGGGSLDVGLDAGLDAGADLGGGSATVALDTGLDVGSDLGAGSLDAGLDAGLDVGLDSGADAGIVTGLDVGLDAGIDLAGGDVDAGLDAALDLGLAEIEVQTDLEVDAGGLVEDLAGGLDTGLDSTIEDVLDPGGDQDTGGVLGDVLDLGGGGGGGGLSLPLL